MQYIKEAQILSKDYNYLYLLSFSYALKGKILQNDKNY